MKGVGTFGIVAKSAPAGQRIVATSRSHGTKCSNAAVDAVQPTQVLRVGGAGHKVLLVVEGQAHVYVFATPGCKKWDTCAPEAVLHAAGGKLTDMFGHDLQYHKEVDYVNRAGVLAAQTPQTHADCLSTVPEDVKAALLPSNL